MERSASAPGANHPALQLGAGWLMAASAYDIAYSYEDCPTLRDFALSDAFVRGVMGPFGCLSGDTEYLSPTGWRRIDAYDGGLVTQWDRATGRVELVQPEGYTDTEATELIEFDCGSLVMRLSADHRVPHIDWNGRFAVADAAQIEKCRSRRTIPTTFCGPDLDGLGMSDDLIRFAVMMHADGHYPKQGRRAVVCLRKERKKERLRALLGRMGVPFREHIPSQRPTETNFRFVPPYRGKRFTGRWWRASGRELAIVMDEMVHWDGHAGEITVFASAYREDADFIQYAAHATGRRAVIAEVEPRNAAWRTHYRVAVRVSDNAKNRVCIREATQIRRVPALNGRMYCFAVPSTFFLARCDGTIFITGNSGKSSACAVEVVRRGRLQARGRDGVARSRWAVVRNTYGELRDTTIKTFMQWFPEAYFGRYLSSDHNYTIKAFPQTEIEVIFRALDRPDHVKHLLSLELTGAWVNEAREIPWGVIEALQGRVWRYPSMAMGGPTWSGIWMDTNPPDTDSKWYGFFEERRWLKQFPQLVEAGILPPGAKPEDYAQIFKQPSGLSPQAENLTNLARGRGYYVNLSIDKAAEWIKIYVEGQYGFVVEGRLVYPEYVDKVHCRELDPVDGAPIIRSWDFGLCYSDDTEVLTSNGWKLFKDVDERTDLAASRDPTTGYFEWAPIAFKIAEPFRGDLLHWQSTELDMLVTPEHRVPFTYRDSPGVVHWQSAEWLAEHMSGHHYVDLTSRWMAGFAGSAGIVPISDGFAMSARAYAEFMGLYLSEGSTNRGRIAIYQRDQKPDMQRILDATGLPWRFRDTGKAAGWTLYHRGLGAHLKVYGRAQEKSAPILVKEMPRADIEAFIWAYTAGDGHVRTCANGSVEHTVFTTSKAMADDFQEMAQKVGWNSSLRRVKPQTSVLDGRTITNGGGYSITFKKRATRAELHRRNFSRVPYDGFVYCLNVPHHTLYVRRGGKPHWNGNTPACVFSQVLPDGTWLVFDEMTSDNMSIDQFSDEVLEHCARAFRHSRPTFEDYGDPAGNERAQTDKRTCFEIMRSKDIQIEGSIQDPTLRQESVRKLLRTPGADWEPRFALHPRCRMLRKGFMGGYHRRRLQVSGPERYAEAPEKNMFCVPLDTEILTPEGWCDWETLGRRHSASGRRGYAVYGYNMETGRLEPTIVGAVNFFEGQHEAVRIAGEHSAWVSTPAHRNVVVTRAGRAKIVRTSDLNEGHTLLLAAPEDRPRKQQPFSDDFISLAAWVMAEGTYRPADDAVTLCQSATHNPAYCEYLDALLAKFPGTIRHDGPRTNGMRTWRIRQETAWLLRQWMPLKAPSAAFVARMSNANRRRFLYEFWRGDGHAGGPLDDPGPITRLRDFRPTRTSARAFQKRVDAVDALQMMATLAGVPLTVRPARAGFVMTLQTAHAGFGLQERTRKTVEVGAVWCPETALGTWVCRQGGRTFITGNSHPHDALQYGVVKYFGPALRGEREDDDDGYPFGEAPIDYAAQATRSKTTGY